MFKFKCISSYCVDMGDKMFVKAINEEGTVDLLIYGRHSDIDTLMLMEVEGKIKDENKSYLIVNSVNIIDKFELIRESFSKLSVAILFLEISYRANCCFSLLTSCLNKLKEWDTLPSFVCFLYLFLKENGIFNEFLLNKAHLSLLKELEQENIKMPKAQERKALSEIKNILIREVQAYLGRELNSLKLIKAI